MGVQARGKVGRNVGGGVVNTRAGWVAGMREGGQNRNREGMLAGRRGG